MIIPLLMIACGWIRRDCGVHLFTGRNRRRLFLSLPSFDSCSYKGVKYAGALPCWPIEWQAA